MNFANAEPCRELECLMAHQFIVSLSSESRQATTKMKFNPLKCGSETSTLILARKNAATRKNKPTNNISRMKIVEMAFV